LGTKGDISDEIKKYIEEENKCILWVNGGNH
jgi:hypothetical protein